MTFLTYTSPVSINLYGVSTPFTGLMMFRPGPGQTTEGDSCGCSDCTCMVVSFNGGVFVESYQSLPGKCPAEYPSGFPPALNPTEFGSYYSLGYRWGDPDDLLANFPLDGCCGSYELQVPDLPTLDFNDLRNNVSLNGSLQAELTAANAENTVLSAQLTAANIQITEQTTEIAILTSQRDGLQSAFDNCVGIATAGQAIFQGQIADLLAEIDRLTALLPVGAGEADPVGDEVAATIAEAMAKGATVKSTTFSQRCAEEAEAEGGNGEDDDGVGTTGTGEGCLGDVELGDGSVVSLP